MVADEGSFTAAAEVIVQKRAQVHLRLGSWPEK